MNKTYVSICTAIFSFFAIWIILISDLFIKRRIITLDEEAHKKAWDTCSEEGVYGVSLGSKTSNGL